jgi:hypothetical protein
MDRGGVGEVHAHHRRERGEQRLGEMRLAGERKRDPARGAPASAEAHRIQLARHRRAHERAEGYGIRLERAADEVRVSLRHEEEITRAQLDLAVGGAHAARSLDHQVRARDAFRGRHRHAPRLLRGRIQRNAGAEAREAEDFGERVHYRGQTPIKLIGEIIGVRPQLS